MKRQAPVTAAAVLGAWLNWPGPVHGLDAGDFGLVSSRPGPGIALGQNRVQPTYPAVEYYPPRWYNSPFQFRRTPPDRRDRPRIYCALGQEGCDD